MSFLGLDINSSGAVKIAAVVLGLITCNNWASGRLRAHVEHKIKEQLTQTIGPADRYEVNVKAGMLSLLTGRMDKLTIHADSVFMKKRAEMQTLDVEMRGLRFGLWSSSFSGARSATVRATMNSDQLQRYLTRKYTDVTDITCRLETGKFYLNAKPCLIGFDMPVKSEGTLRISAPDSISFDLQKVTVIGITAPDFITRYITNKFNPVMQTSEFGLKAKLTNFTVEDNKASIEADLDVRNGIGFE